MQEYRVCAVVVADEVTEEIRAELLPFLLKGQRKFHWIAERRQRRQTFLTTISRLNLDSIIVIDRSTPQRHEERRRRKALELLYLTLENLGVAEVVLESRTATQDHMDIKHIAGLKSAGLFTAFQLTHVRGGDEPLLWISDTLLGAENAARNGDLAFANALTSLNLEILATTGGH
jgi:hypothetical protein